MPSLSVIIPTLNEEKNPYFYKILTLLSSYKNIEVIVSDGGSCDETSLLCSKFNVKYLSNKTTSRAERINQGIKHSSNKMILLQHPRSLISNDGVEFLIKNSNKLKWGGFKHSFDLEHPILSFTSWYSNNVRGNLRGIIYLDHCIFLKKSMAVSIGKLPPVDIFEDTILSQKLLEKYGKPKVLSYKVTTSAIRFKTNGIFKQAIMNQLLKIKYYKGADNIEMNKIYEKDLELNAHYED